MVASAVLSIVSPVIGGALVLAVQFFVRRAEYKWVWLIRLGEAASDLATSYRQEAVTANGRRRAGVDRGHVETATYEFQSAYKSAQAAGSEFMRAVGAQILRDGAYR